MHTSAVASLDEKTDIRVHERNSHGHGRAIRQNKVGVLAELLDKRKDIIPAAAVETRAVVAELIDDLVHFKGSVDGLNQNGGTDSAAGKTDVVLGQVEGIIPQTSLEVRFHLGEVKVRAKAALDQLARIVEKVQTKVKQRAGHGFAVDGEMLLLKVPAASTGDEGGQGSVGAQLVLFVTLLKVHLAADGIVQVDLAVDHVFPCWGRGVYKFWSVTALSIGSHKNIPSKSAM